jgi:hypothetical protein
VGLLAPIAREMVELTTEGQLYLDGDLDARHRPRPAPGVPNALEA